MYHLIVASFEAKRYEKTHLKSVTFLTIEGEATRGSFVTIQYPGGTSCASQAPMALRQFVEMVESVCGWPQTLSTISTLCAPQARVLDAFLNLDDFIGFQAVGLAVYRCCRLLVGSLDKAEHFATALIKPILQVLYAVLFLCLYIRFVRMLYCLCGQPLDSVMDIHIKWHSFLLL